MAQTVDQHGLVWQLEISRRGLHLARPRWRKDSGDWFDLDLDFDDPFSFLFALVLGIVIAAVVIPLLVFTAELLVVTVPLAVIGVVLSLLGRVSVAAVATGQPVISETRWGVRSEDRARAAVIERISAR